MVAEDPFDLSRFLTDSLSLEANVAAQTRKMFPTQEPTPYLELFQMDPLEVLGEKSFGKPNCARKKGEETQLQGFLRDKHVLITGGTGFIGKVLVQKLIRANPDIGHVYLLIRGKRGKNFEERFKQLMDDQVFLRMKTEVPHYHSKISALDGDISQTGLGLSEAERQLLRDRVHIVFHGAADVRFTEHIKDSTQANVEGSRRMLNLAKTMTNLQAYVHVSTAYSHCVRRVIEETVPAMSIDYKETLDYISRKTYDELDEETPRLLQEYPNPYTFSKAVTENMIVAESEDLPICIFRPSVVGPTYQEPVRGWLDNVYGPFGMLLGVILGVIHCFRVDDELALDIVPVDYVANCMIATAWKIATTSAKKGLQVYNFTATSSNCMTWKGIHYVNNLYKDRWLSIHAIWYHSFIISGSYWVDALCHVLLHKLPGYFLDKLAVMWGQKPRLTKLYSRIETVKEKMHYFLFSIWEFRNDNVMGLWRTLSEEDKREFNFDTRDINLTEYVLMFRLGIRYYYLKDKMETLPAATRKGWWLYWAHTTLKLVSGLLVLKMMVCVAHLLPV